MEPISIDTAAAVDPNQISIDVGNQPTILPDAVVKQRAAQAEYGLKDKVSKTYDDYYRAFSQGQEPDIRKEVAADIGFQQTIQKYQNIKDFALAKGHPLTPDDMNNLQNFINTPAASPDSVIEKGYADKYVDTFKNVPGTWYEDAMQTMPIQVKQTEEDTSEYLTKQKIADTQLENAHASVSDQSWTGFLVDQAKFGIPLYNEIKLRGLVESVSRFSGLLGNNLTEQADSLLRLPMPEYEAKFTAIMDHLKEDNPTLAVTFADAVKGQSVSEKLLNNVFSAVDISGIGGLVKGGVGLLRNVTGKALVYNDIRKLGKEAVAQAASPDAVGKAPEVVAASAAGDMRTAGVSRASTTLLDEVKGTGEPAKEAIDGLTSVMKADAEDIKTAGSFGNEVANRIYEQAYNFTNNFSNALANTLKVERLPAIQISKDLAAQIIDDSKDLYTGLKNALLDIRTVYRNPVTNTYHIEFQVGRHSGEMFGTREEAQSFATTNGLTIKNSMPNSQAIRKTDLESQIILANDKLEQYRAAPSTPDIQFRIDNIEKGLKAYRTELKTLVPSPTGVTIESKGTGFYISMTKPVDETSRVIRDAILSVAENKDPEGWLNAFGGWLRTPGETLSVSQRRNRNIASYASSNLLKVAKEEAQYIAKIRPGYSAGKDKKQIFSDWDRTIKYSRDALDPITGEKGYFFRDPTELDVFYRQTFQRGVSPAEAEAYFAFTRIIEMDRSLRNMNLYKFMSRLGTEMHSINLLDEQGKAMQTPFFHGILQKELPGGDDTVAVFGEKQGQEYIRAGNAIPPRKYGDLKKAVDSGEYKVIRLYNPELRPLQGVGSIGDQRIRYAVVKSSESKPLPYDLIPRRGGGHFDFDYEHYIKQGRVRYDKSSGQFWYEGDTTLMPVNNRAMGHDIVKQLELVRLRLQAKNEVGAKQAAANLPMPWKDVKAWFYASKDAAGKDVAARFNLKEPFQVVPRNKMILDQDRTMYGRYLDKNHESMLKDGTKSGSDARQYSIEYTGQRDVYDMSTMRNDGTAQNPVWQNEPAKLIDPIPTMNRALTRIVNSSTMDDYKIFSVEHWLAQAEKYLKEDWRSAPFYHFNKPDYVPGIAPEIRSRLEMSRFNIQQFTGIASKTQALLDSFAAKLSDSAYRKNSKLLNIASTASANLTEVAPFMHKVTYHAVIGLFSPVQLMVQSMSYATIYGIAGASKAIPGSMGALLHQYARWSKNPAILEQLDKIASSMHVPGSSRWRPGEWKEAMQTLDKTGFSNLAGEHMMLDHVYSPATIQSVGHTLLDAGTMFFKGAERNVRFGAWYTAFREFRDAKPTGILTSLDQAKIFDRANILAGDMSRASKSTLQMGALSFPAQFLGYQLRLAELMTSPLLGGNRITGKEAIRLFATYAALYGLPVASGATLFPFTDYIKKAAMENGYIVGENFLTSLVMEGGLAGAMAAISNTWYDPGQRYGAPGADIIRDTIASDKTWWSILGGASGSIFAGALEQSSGFYHMAMSMFSGKFPAKSEDFLDPFKEITTVNSAWRLYTALNMHKWMSRNETVVSNEVSSSKALFMTLTGLQEQDWADMTRVSWSLKDREAQQKYTENKFIKEFRRGLNEQKNNPEEAKGYFTRAYTWAVIGDLPNEKLSNTIAQAMNDYEDLPSRLNWDFYLKDVPESKKDSFYDAYRRRLAIGKGQIH